MSKFSVTSVYDDGKEGKKSVGEETLPPVDFAFSSLPLSFFFHYFFQHNCVLGCDFPIATISEEEVPNQRKARERKSKGGGGLEGKEEGKETDLCSEYEIHEI